jgi:hypothetical protein
MTKTTTVGAKTKKKSLRVRLAEKAGARNREIHERGHFTVKERTQIEEIVRALWLDAGNR